MRNPWLRLFHDQDLVVGDSTDLLCDFYILRRQGQPLLYVPVDPHLAIQSLQIYAAQTNIARLARLAMRLTLKDFAPFFYERETVRLPLNSSLASFFRELHPNAKLNHFAVLCGNSNTAGQRHVFLFLDERTHSGTVVKAGQTPRARELINAEANFIQGVSTSFEGIPKLMGVLRNDYVAAFATHFYSEEPYRKDEDVKVFGILSSWINSEDSIPLQEVPSWQRIWQHPHPFLARIKAATQQQLIKSTLFHGDFAPWNIRASGSHWTVLDWERGELRGVPAWDWFHYIVQDSILVRKQKAPATFARLQALVSSKLFRRYAEKTGIHNCVPSILAGYLLYARSLRQTEGAEQIENLLHCMDEFWPGWGDLSLVFDSDLQADRPKFSIITPSYGQLDWLRLCIASVRDQNDTLDAQRKIHIEHLIQDGGSANIDSVIAENGHQSHATAEFYRIDIQSASDRGMYDGINRGFLRAQGEIVSWLNCDEQYLPDTLQTIADFFDRHKEVDIVFGDAVLVDVHGELLSYRRAVLPRRLHTQVAHLNTLSCATFFRRRLIERGFLMDCNSKTVADAKWVAALLDAGVKMAVIPKPLSIFVMTEANLGQTALAKLEMEEWRSKAGFFRRLLTEPAIVFHRWRKFMAGAYALRSGNFSFYKLSNPTRRQASYKTNISHKWPVEVKFTRLRRVLSKNWLTKQMVLVGVVFPLIFSTASHYIDHLVIGITLTPFFSIVCLLTLAFFFSPAVVAAAAAIFCGSALLSFLDFANILDQEKAGRGFVLIRFASFMAASTGAVLLSLYRQTAARNRALHTAILTDMTVPLITSNAMGLVTFANTQALRLLNESEGSVIGKKWAGLAMANTDEGEATQLYLKIFEGTTSHAKSLDLNLPDYPRKIFKGIVVCIGEGRERMLLTTWQTEI